MIPLGIILGLLALLCLSMPYMGDWQAERSGCGLRVTDGGGRRE